MTAPASITPEREGREGDQPLPTEGQGGDIIGELIELLNQRRSTGLRRYGRPLHAFNGRDVSRDELEEFVDGYVYRRQQEAEMAAMEEAVIVLANCVEFDPAPGDAVDSAMKLAAAIEAKRARLAERAG